MLTYKSKLFQRSNRLLPFTVYCSLVISIFSAYSPLLHANYLQPLSGEEIMQKRKQFDSGWQSSAVELEMTLVSASGEKTVRKLRTRSLEVANDGDKSLSVFDAPRDVKGVAFLNHSHIQKMDDQWLYLPSLKRIKRISSSNKSGSFMGSEFAFEDMSSFEVEKFDYLSASIDSLEDIDTYIVESRPLDKNSGYSRIKSWIHTAHYQPLKVEFYDKKNELLKVLHLYDYREYDNGIWRAHHLAMENMQSGKKTLLKNSNFDFTVSLTDKDFKKNTLKRVR